MYMYMYMYTSCIYTDVHHIIQRAVYNTIHTCTCTCTCTYKIITCIYMYVHVQTYKIIVSMSRDPNVCTSVVLSIVCSTTYYTWNIMCIKQKERRKKPNKPMCMAHYYCVNIHVYTHMYMYMYYRARYNYMYMYVYTCHPECHIS